MKYTFLPNGETFSNFLFQLIVIYYQVQPIYEQKKVFPRKHFDNDLIKYKH